MFEGTEGTTNVDYSQLGGLYPSRPAWNWHYPNFLGPDRVHFRLVESSFGALELLPRPKFSSRRLGLPSLIQPGILPFQPWHLPPWLLIQLRWLFLRHFPSRPSWPASSF